MSAPTGAAPAPPSPRPPPRPRPSSPRPTRASKSKRRPVLGHPVHPRGRERYPLTFVPGSLKVKAAIERERGLYTVAYCTAAMGYLPGECTAKMTGNYKTTYPYIETFLNVRRGDRRGCAGAADRLRPVHGQRRARPSARCSTTTRPSSSPRHCRNLAARLATPDLDAYPSTNACTGDAVGCTPCPTWRPHPAGASRSPHHQAPDGHPVSPSSGRRRWDPRDHHRDQPLGRDRRRLRYQPGDGVRSIRPDSITATSPAGTGTVDVTVTTPSARPRPPRPTSTPTRAAPTVTGVSPSSGLAEVVAPA